MKRFGIVVLFLVSTSLRAQDSGPTLADLIETNDRAAALERIREGADVNAPEPDGTRPIHWAVYRVDDEILDALISSGADPNVRNDFGATPIAQAAGIADARIVEKLLDAGAEPEGANPDGQTALMLAIQTGETGVVRLLIDAGADVNAVETFRGQTPLMWAAGAGRNAGEMVRMLLAAGADVTPRAMFIDWPAQITAEPRAQYRPTGGLTALLYAARDGCADCVDALIDAGAAIDRPTPEGVTPLLIALDNDRYDVAQLLLDRGADPGLWDWWGRTALYITVDRRACDRDSGGNCGRVGGASLSVSRLDIINSLVAAGVDPNPQLNFHRPSRGGNSGRFIDPLLGTGATPLSRATMAGDVELVRILLEAGADPNINVMGLTPFLIAAGVGPDHIGGTGLAAEYSAGGPVNVELMALLLENGADVNDRITGTETYSMRITRAPSANEGRTALHIAAAEGDVERVRYLLAEGADPEITDPNGLRAIDMVGEDAPAAEELRALLRSAASNPQDRLGALVDRIQALEDRESIRRLILDYGTAHDHRDYRALAALFARDGEWVSGMGTAKGPDAIFELMDRAIGHNPTAKGSGTFHVLTNDRITVHGDRAEAVTKWMYVTPGEGGSPNTVLLGHYDDQFVREDGIWKFLRREAPVDLPAGN